MDSTSMKKSAFLDFLPFVFISCGFMIMAGMLPGVEYARRRRLHLGGPSTDATRRSSFSVYTTAHEKTTKRSILNQELHDEALGHIAREAKERLDARLKIRRHNSAGSMEQSKNEGQGELHEIPGNVQREVYSSKNSKKKFSWSKMGWTSPEQSDCAVCLEEYKTGDILVHLPCAHRFHWNCAQPWLETSSYCPCCRTTIFAEWEQSVK
ncbi:hypothetical protein ZIOFF_037137 [Zingiber officinale]|uniref:RING-type E3 ubiquitin transferase n=2 Tax=Zingiber officinale TaxID=94328 RepID=A0A8J5L8V5_ZINOF|nr:hypothetical protein ZIOFF_037137 [Zingiber officinale]